MFRPIIKILSTPRGQQGPAGGVQGPGSSSAGNLPIFSDTSGQAIQDSGKAFSTDGAFSANSDLKIPTEKAGKNYSDNVSSANPYYTEYGMARQAIMNGNFDIAQRIGPLGSINVPDVTIVFGLDRWLDYATKDGGTLPTLTRSQQLLTSGDIPGAKYFTRLATNGAGTSLGVNSLGQYLQRIENGVSKLCGLNKKVTISFWARSSIANKRICPVLQQNYGSGGSPSATEIIKGTPITLTSTWTKYAATFNTNTLVGKTLGTNGDDFLETDFVYMWGTTIGNTNVQTSVTAETFVGSGNIDIAQVQLCAGDVALPFQPKSYEEEKRQCMRYYEKSWSDGETSANASVTVFHNCGISYNSGNIAGGNTQFKVAKRIAPTITTYDVAHAVNKVSWAPNSGSMANGAPVPTIQASTEQFSITGGGMPTSSAGIMQFHWEAPAEL